MRSLACTLLTIERTCLERSSWCSWPHGRPIDPASGWANGAGVLKRFAFCNFNFRQGSGATPGGSSPRPVRARGGTYRCCGRAAPDLRVAECSADRSLRGNRLEPALNVGGVGHSCDLGVGHSCDLPIDLISITWDSYEVILLAQP